MPKMASDEGGVADEVTNDVTDGVTAAARATALFGGYGDGALGSGGTADVRGLDGGLPKATGGGYGYGSFGAQLAPYRGYAPSQPSVAGDSISRSEEEGERGVESSLQALVEMPDAVAALASA